MNQNPGLPDPNALISSGAGQLLAPAPVAGAIPRVPTVHLNLPKPFTGAGDDVIDFLSTFERIAYVYQWDDAQKAHYIPACLAGDAAAEWARIPVADRRDYESVVKHFRDKYAPERLRSIYCLELTRTPQGEDEKVSEYQERVRKLGQRGFPNLPPDQRDQILMEFFLNGLRTDLLAQTRLTRPKSFDEAVLAAKELETIQLITPKVTLSRLGIASESDRREKKPMSNYPMIGMLTEPLAGASKQVQSALHGAAPNNNDALVQLVTDRLDQMEFLIQQNAHNAPQGAVVQTTGQTQQNQPQRQYNSGPQQQNRGRVGPNGEAAFTSDGRPICFHCRKVGHTKPVCRQRIEEERRQTPATNNYGQRSGQPQGNPGQQQPRPTQCFRCNGYGHIARNCSSPSPAAYPQQQPAAGQATNQRQQQPYTARSQPQQQGGYQGRAQQGMQGQESGNGWTIAQEDLLGYQSMEGPQGNYGSRIQWDGHNDLLQNPLQRGHLYDTNYGGYMEDVQDVLRTIRGLVQQDGNQGAPNGGASCEQGFRGPEEPAFILPTRDDDCRVSSVIAKNGTDYALRGFHTYLPITISGKRFYAMVDTGATMSFMHPRVWDAMGRPHLEQIAMDMPCSMSGHTLELLGTFLTSMDMYGHRIHAAVHVHAHAPSDILFGTNVLAQYDMLQINFRMMTMRMCPIADIRDVNAVVYANEKNLPFDPVVPVPPPSVYPDQWPASHQRTSMANRTHQPTDTHEATSEEADNPDIQMLEVRNVRTGATGIQSPPPSQGARAERSTGGTRRVELVSDHEAAVGKFPKFLAGFSEPAERRPETTPDLEIPQQKSERIRKGYADKGCQASETQPQIQVLTDEGSHQNPAKRQRVEGATGAEPDPNGRQNSERLPSFECAFGRRREVPPMSFTTVLVETQHSLLDYQGAIGVVIEGKEDLEAQFGISVVPTFVPFDANQKNRPIKVVVMNPTDAAVPIPMDQQLLEVDLVRHSDVQGVTVPKSRTEDEHASEATQAGQGLGYVPLEADHEELESEEERHSQMLTLGETPALTDDERVEMQALVREYSDVFAKSDFDLGQLKEAEFGIDTGDANPIRQKGYHHSDVECELIDEAVDEMLTKRICRGSGSSWASPVVLAPKKDGKLRFCVNYRKLNDVTVTDSYPIPRIDDLIRKVRGAKYFACLDIVAAYWHIPVRECDIPKTAFVCHRGLFEFLVMPFGVKNGPSHWMRAILLLLASVISKTTTEKGVEVYFDDIFPHAENFVQFLELCRDIFECFRQGNVRLRFSKCKFGQTEVSFLGMIVSGDGVRPDPTKIKALEDYTTPTNIRQVRGFLGLASFNRRFIQNFAKIAAPLVELTKHVKATRRTSSKIPIKWTDECEASFQALKKALTEAAMQPFADPELPYILYTDASNVGIGAALAQENEGVERTIAYASRALSAQERNWSVTEREAIAVIWALGHFRTYLHFRDVTVYTDHEALRWYFNKASPKGKQARWMMEIQEYNCTIKYKPGKANSAADCMSRLPVYEADEDNNDIEDGIECETPAATSHDAEIVPELQQLFCEAEDGPTAAEEWNDEDNEEPEADSDIGDENEPELVRDTRLIDETCPITVPTIIREQKNDPWCNGLRLALESGDMSEIDPVIAKLCVLEAADCVLDNGIVYHLWSDTAGPRRKALYKQLVVPAELRSTILFACHDDLFGGHFSTEKTYLKIRQRYYWKNMHKDVETWVRRCRGCGTRKAPGKRIKAPLQPIPVGQPFDRVAVDCVGPLRKTERGNEHIIVFSDYLTKYAEVVPIPNTSAPTLAWAFVKEIVCRHGAPITLLSDRGAGFLSNLVTEVCAITATKKVNTTSYHPQCDGLVERFNKTLADRLSMYASENQKDWDLFIPFAVMAYNTSIQSSTKDSPFYLMYGRQARLPFESAVAYFESRLRNDLPLETSYYIDELLQRLSDAREFAHANIKAAQETQKKYYDRKAKDPEFRVGEKVYLHIPAIKRGMCGKLVHKWRGPLEIVEVVSPSNIKVKDAKEHVHLVHVNRIKRDLGDGIPNELPEDFNEEQGEDDSPDETTDELAGPSGVNPAEDILPLDQTEETGRATDKPAQPQDQPATEEPTTEPRDDETPPADTEPEVIDESDVTVDVVYNPEFPPGTRVWAKIRGYPAHPAAVVSRLEFPLEIKKNSTQLPVRFFGAKLGEEFALVASNAVQRFETKQYNGRNKEIGFIAETVAANPNMEPEDLTPEMVRVGIANRRRGVDPAQGGIFHRQRDIMNLQRTWLFVTTMVSLLPGTNAFMHDMQPMLCRTSGAGQIWRLPDHTDCPRPESPRQGTPKRERLILYRYNHLQYEADAHLCTKITREMKTFTYFFDDEHLKKENVINEVISAEECLRMIRRKQCDAGKMQYIGNTWQTGNELKWKFPGGGIDCCKWKTFTATNCFLSKVKVIKHHDHDYMESTAGDVRHCNYAGGSCALDEGKFLIWTPATKEACKLLPWKNMGGERLGNVWISEDNTLALTYSHRQPLRDCDGNKVKLSDQGIATADSCRTCGRDRRSASHGGPADASVIAGELQAIEEKLHRSIREAFMKTYTLTCQSMGQSMSVLRALMSTEPTATARAMFNTSLVYARSAGTFFQVFPCQGLTRIEFLPSNGTCHSRIPIRILNPIGNRTGLMDPTTGIVTLTDFPDAQKCVESGPILFAFKGNAAQYFPNGSVSTVKEDGKFTLLNPQMNYSFHLPHTIYHELIMYSWHDLDTHVSINDVFAEMNNQKQILRSIGLDAPLSDGETKGLRAVASDWVSKGFFGFLSGLKIDLWQVWVFLVCLTVTGQTVGSLILKVVRKYVQKRVFRPVKRSAPQGAVLEMEQRTEAPTEAPRVAPMEAPRVAPSEAPFAGLPVTQTVVIPIQDETVLGAEEATPATDSTVTPEHGTGHHHQPTDTTEPAYRFPFLA